MSLSPDHIIYAVPDLSRAIDHFAALTGVQPVFGGRHLGRGSHNALLSLGPHVYLEIIAPDPEQPIPSGPRSFGLDRDSGPRLVTWAVRAEAIETVVSQSRQAGYDPGEIFPGARLRGDGLQMTWRLTRRPEPVAGEDPPGDWLVPFLISWGDTPHPAASSPAGCTLVKVEAVHPRPDEIVSMLQALRVEIDVKKGVRPALQAVLDTPRGKIFLL